MAAHPNNDLRQVHDNTIIAGALLTLSVLIFITYLSESPNKLVPMQIYSLIAFAIAIPGLSFWYYLSKNNQAHKVPQKHIYPIIILFSLSVFSAVIGIALTIWRYNYIAGLAFTVVCILCFIYYELTDGSQTTWR